MPRHIANCLLWVICARFRMGGGKLEVRELLSRWRFKLGPLCIDGVVPHFLIKTIAYHHERVYTHTISFVPCRRPKHPSLFYIALFVGTMQWGDSHAGATYFRPKGRFLMLRAAAVLAAGIIAVLPGLVWWAGRAAHFCAWLLWEVV